MVVKKRGLNKGLDALLSDAFNSLPVNANTGLNKSTVVTKNIINNNPVINSISEVNISLLSPGRFQPRKKIQEEELVALSESIRQQGLLQPVVVRMIDNGRYEIIAGERRWRASQLIGLKKIPVLIKEVSDQDAAAIGLIENIQRENLNPMEEAIALERLVVEFKLTHAQIAQAIGKSRAAVTNLLRLMSLEPGVKLLLEDDKIDLGHAKVLLALQGKKQMQAAQIVSDKNLSVRETESLVNQIQNQLTIDQENNKLTKKSPDPDIMRLQTKLSETIGSPVKIIHGSKGRGKLIITYNNLDELDGVLSHIN